MKTIFIGDIHGRDIWKKIVESENKIDDILLPFLDSLEAEIKKFVDKIDGVVDAAE